MADIALQTHIRPLVFNDLEACEAIERQSHANPWNMGELVYQYGLGNTMGYVADFQGAITGFMIYKLAKKEFRLMDVAVDPDFLRLGVGTQLMRKLIGKLTVRSRPRITPAVTDDNLPAQLFFRSLGFPAIDTIAFPMVNVNSNSEEEREAYLFEYDIDATPGSGVTLKLGAKA